MLTAIDYFTEWVVMAPCAKITSKHVAKFLLNNIIYSYGVAYELISDQGIHFKKEVTTLLEKYKIQHYKSSPYCPQANGVVEASNQNVQSIIEKMAKNYKDWPDKLPFFLWGYMTSTRTSIEATLHSLMYGMEIVPANRNSNIIPYSDH